jgi:subtilisin-like proprotein convertase family protein
MSVLVAVVLATMLLAVTMALASASPMEGVAYAPVASPNFQPTMFRGNVGGQVPPGCSIGGQLNANSTPLPIVDNSTATSQIVVSGAETFLLRNDLFTSIQHTFAADLDMTMTSPQGTQVTISTDNGGGNDNVFSGTLWYDGAGIPATDNIYVNNVPATDLVVEEAFGAFYGEDPNGTWTLDIFDDAGGDTGTLSYWDFFIETTTAAPVIASQSFTNSTPVPIADNTTASSQILVTGVPTYLVDLDLQTFIQHTFASDLDITLTSPQGTVVTISTDNGGGNDNVFDGTVWDDDGGDTNPPGPVSDNIYTNLVVETPLVVEEALSAFYGEDPNGTWTIDIFDDAGGDTGTLNQWSLSVHTGSCPPPPPTPAPSLTFTKTVGMDPNACATTNSIIIPAGGGGTNVTYCYEMTNTGNVTFELHTILDDQLGTVVGPELPATVGPGNSASFTATTLITQTTVNIASWTASDVDYVYVITATDTATVTQGAPTDVSLSSFGSDGVDFSPVWIVAMFAIILGFGFILRRKWISVE